MLDISETDLKNFFSKFGRIAGVRKIANRTEMSFSRAYVEYASEEMVGRVLGELISEFVDDLFLQSKFSFQFVVLIRSKTTSYQWPSSEPL